MKLTNPIIIWNFILTENMIIALWNSIKLPFTLVTSSHWIITNENKEEAHIICPGNRIAYEKAFTDLKNGTYVAKTKLVNPCTRKVMIIGGTSSPIKASIDGKIIFEDMNKTEFMPAYHRATNSKKAIIDLPAGEHLLEIEVTKDDSALEVFILTVAPNETKKPGSNYYFIDTMML